MRSKRKTTERTKNKTSTVLARIIFSIYFSVYFTDFCSKGNTFRSRYRQRTRARSFVRSGDGSTIGPSDYTAVNATSSRGPSLHGVVTRARDEDDALKGVFRVKRTTRHTRRARGENRKTFFLCSPRQPEPRAWGVITAGQERRRFRRFDRF